MEDQDRQRLASIEAKLRALTARLNALSEGNFEINAEGFRVGSTRIFEKLVGSLYHLHQRDSSGTENDLTDALSIQGVDVSTTAPTAAQVMVYDATLEEWTMASSSTPGAHALGGAAHTADTLANLNTKVSDATLDTSTASRPPSGGAGGDLGGTYPNPSVDDGADSTAIHDNVANEITAITVKATPVAADELVIEDSAASFVKKAVTFAAFEGALTHDNLVAGTIAGHDTGATGAELDTLTDGSDAADIHIHDARYFTEAEHLASSAGAGDSGKPVKLDAAGHVDASMINDGDVDHGNLAGLDTGADHSYIDQDVTSASTPTFTGTNFTGIPWAGVSKTGSGVADLATKVVDNLSDVDTTTDSPAKSEVLKWNGSNWVPATYNYNFTFSVASFSDGEATTQLIGSGEWEAADAVIFAATYNNGPPTSADVLMSINGAAYNDVGHMDGAAYTSGKNYDGAINYPAAKDQYLRFRLDATDGVDPDIEYESAIYFRNKIFYGVIAKADTFTEADIEGLAGSAISNAINRSFNLAPGAGEYMVYAYPTSYTAMDEGSDYEVDGGTDFKFNSIAIAMTRDNAALSITNTAGFTEDYDVYVSDVANLGSHTFYANTSGATINYLYWGELNVASTADGASVYTEANVEDNAASQPGKVASNSISSREMIVNCAAGEYAYIAYPARLGALTSIMIGGFESIGDFWIDANSGNELTVTNANGWNENYYVYVSKNHSLSDPTTMTVSL